jgi:RNA polymerase sigma-70 factor (ECF subfamily)
LIGQAVQNGVGKTDSMATPVEQRRTEFEAEVLVHLDALFGLALRLTGGDEPGAEDLVQESMLKAYRSWDRFETGTNSRAWLMTILRNTFINHYRKQKSRPVPVDYEELAERPASSVLYKADPEGRLFRGVMDEEVIAAIDQLPEDFRVVVVLSDVEGLSYQEVADLVDVPVGTVKSRLFRARRRLQERLYDYAVDMGYLK